MAVHKHVDKCYLGMQGRSLARYHLCLNSNLTQSFVDRTISNLYVQLVKKRSEPAYCISLGCSLGIPAIDFTAEARTVPHTQLTSLFSTFSSRTRTKLPTWCIWSLFLLLAERQTISVATLCIKLRHMARS